MLKRPVSLSTVLGVVLKSTDVVVNLTTVVPRGFLPGVSCGPLRSFSLPPSPSPSTSPRSYCLGKGLVVSACFSVVALCEMSSTGPVPCPFYILHTNRRRNRPYHHMGSHGLLRSLRVVVSLSSIRLPSRVYPLRRT